MNFPRRKPKGLFEKVPGSGEWWIRYADTTGRIRREKAGTKSAALDLYRKRKTEALQGKKLPERLRSPAVSFVELATDAKTYSKAHKRSYATDLARMNRLLDWFRDRQADTITPQEIERHLEEAAQDEGWKPATVNRYRALLSLIYRLGIRNGKVSVNPARLVRNRPENNARIRYLTAKEEKGLREVILAQFSEHLPEFELVLNTGLRRGEMYGLTWDNVNLARRILTVPRSKNGTMRHVPLNRPAVAALKTLRQRSDGSGPVIRNLSGEPLAGPRHWFEDTVREAKIENFSWHCLRHTFASRLVMAGVDLRTVQELMGHQQISMTVRYAHLAPTHQLAAVERLAEAAEAALQEVSTDTKTSTEASELSEAELVYAS